jgi:dienelactone hydrolase
MRFVALITTILLAPQAWAGGSWEELWSADGTIIRGWLETPEGEGPHPAVVMMHSCFGPINDRDELAAHDRSWADILTKNGYAILAVDSYTPRSAGSLCQQRNRPVLASAERPWDAIGGLLFLQERPDIDGDRVGIMGWSNGAITSLWTARDGASAASALEGPDFRTAVAYYPICNDVLSRIDDYMPRIPVLLQIGADDDWTDPEPCRVLAAQTQSRGGDLTLEVYEKSHHLFDAPDMPVRPYMAVNDTQETGLIEIHFGTNEATRVQSIERTLDWFAEYMR